jgi:hypothetical protein
MQKRSMLLLVVLVLAGCARETPARRPPSDGPVAVLTADAGGEVDAASTTATDAAVIVVVDAAPADAPVVSAETAALTRDGPFLGTVPDGAPWQMMCPPGASRADCCSLYCGCMVKDCPATLPSGCQAACEGGGNWDLVCRTYQCFASQNPNFPQDHDSHCRHAIGQQGRCGNR